MVSTQQLPHKMQQLAVHIEKILRTGTQAYRPPQQPTSREHIVPEYIVESFANTKPFYVFSTASNTIIPKNSTKDVCTRNNEYEMLDSKKEIIFRNLIEREYLARIEGWLADFYHSFLQVARTRNHDIGAFLQKQNNRYATILLMSLITLRSPTNLSKFIEACKILGISIQPKEEKNASLLLFVRMLPQFAEKALGEYHIIVLRNKSTMPFVLSSRPAYIKHLIDRYHNDRAQEWTCPLSEDIMLLLVDKAHSMNHDGDIIDIPMCLVDENNQTLLLDKETEQFVCTQAQALKRYQKAWNGRKIKPIKEKHHDQRNYLHHDHRGPWSN